MKIGIIGGTSGLGETLAIILKKHDFEINISGTNHVKGEKIASKIGVNYIKENKDLASLSDILIVSVPIDKTNTVIKEVSDSMNEGSVMIDVTSIKEEPTLTMEKYLPDNVEYIPTHPIFGPRTPDLENQVIVLTPNKKGKWYLKILNFLNNQNMRVIETTASKHDEMMSIVQVLTHFSYISTASAIEKINVDIKETEDFESPIYKLMIDMIARIVSQNPFLTYYIQSKNKNGNYIRSIFSKSVLELEETILNEDIDKFVEIANKATENMGDIQSALGRSDKALTSLNHEYKLLQEAIGLEIGLKNIYSNEIHFGVLKEINSKNILLDNNISIDYSHYELLTNDELLQWKMANLGKIEYTLSCVFKGNVNSGIISKTIEKIDGVIDCKIVQENKLENNEVSLKFKVIGLNEEFSSDVNDLISGFSGKII